MNNASVDRLLAMVPSTEVLSHVTLKPETIELLVNVTYNRGVLLADIHEHVVRSIFALSEAEIVVMRQV